ncbi:shikimate dehydrogenase [Xanthobacter sp. DSM 24535]|uniref:shikimate dehydrogenase n=1 Tax=Roseixanthobacter psychrophilus TaxID=3119917 RepID=UPI0037272F46
MSVKLCISGHPVAYSRSPMLHGYWMEKQGLAGSYGREDVPPEDASAFYANFAAHGYAGGNVTAPNKEIAFRTVAEADETARALGAVNTLWFEDGRLHGGNTDVYGFMANLDAGAPGWDTSGGPVLVLGAGGAARAIVYGLLSRGVEKLWLANRTLNRAQALADQFGPRVVPISLNEIAAPLADAALLVNTTSLGMKGHPPLELDFSPLKTEAVVTDAVYVPLETPLLKAARARGHRIVDGLGMLLHQGVPGFERWFGVRPQVDAPLRDLIVADLRAKGQLEA